MNDEIWKEIPGQDGRYSASNLGRIRSHDIRVRTGKSAFRIHPGKVLTPYLNDNGYLMVTLMRQRKHMTMVLHRLIAATFLGESNGLEVDHKNRVKTDNRAENLRFASHSQNQINSPAGKRNTSGFKGVWRTIWKSRPWRAAIKSEGRRYNLGTFRTRNEAAQAYGEAAKRLHGEFAISSAALRNPEAKGGA